MITPRAADSPQPAAQPTSVYRYYDAVGMLIYVGITKQGMGRNAQHNGKAEWWPHVVRQEVEHYPTRPQAAKREKELIRKFHPPFNKQHNPEHEPLRAAYLAYASNVPMHADPLEVYRATKRRLPLDVVSLNETTLVLRTKLEHAALATSMQLLEAGVPLIGDQHLGRVTDVEIKGYFGYLICRTKPSRMPEQIIAATAAINWQMQKKAHYCRVDKVSIAYPVTGA